MSLPWIAFYPGAYLKNTKDLTLEEHGAYLLLLIECWSKGSIPVHSERKLAQICNISPGRYRRKVKRIVNQYFNADGTNNRATEEIEKAVKIHEKRKLAGAKGGTVAGLNRTLARQANGQAKTKPGYEAKLNQSHKKNITSSLPSAAREEPNPAVGPATALPTGAPSRPPGTTNGEAKGQPRKEVEASKPALPAGTPVDAALYAKLTAGKS